MRHRDTNAEQPGLMREKLSIADDRGNQARSLKQEEERKGPPSWLQADNGDLAQMFPNGLERGNTRPCFPAAPTTSDPATVLRQSLMKSCSMWATGPLKGLVSGQGFLSLPKPFPWQPWAGDSSSLPPPSHRPALNHSMGTLSVLCVLLNCSVKLGQWALP